MRAIVYERFGSPDVLELRLLPEPTPAADEVLVRVKAASLNPKDSLIRKGKFRLASGPRFPKLLGYDVAGVVERVGARVSTLAVGDAVFGMRNGFRGGTVADFVCVKEDECAKKPERLSFEAAAAIPLTSLTALQALRDEARVKAGARVLIHGASGGVGVVAIQLAKALGAHVTATASAKNLDFVRSLGADEALDYTQSRGLESGRDWSCLFDVFGNLSFSLAKPALSSSGVYVSTVPHVHVVASEVLTKFSRGKRARLVVVRSNRADLEVLSSFIEKRQLEPVIDCVVPLSETARGQTHIETKRARGKVVVRVDG